MENRETTQSTINDVLSTQHTFRLKTELHNSRWFYRASMFLGAFCMVVAGFFLVTGLSSFSGDGSGRSVLIVGAILFQLVESFCFVAAAGFAVHSRLWQITLFSLGSILFLFSILVMTLAQKTAMHTGEAEAAAIDNRIQHIEAQLRSYDGLIESYRFNASKQSESIYKDSRALGRDSLDKAAGLEEKKLTLAEELYQLRHHRQQTSSAFFSQLGTLVGEDPNQLEWSFYVGRSVLFELCGILLLSFGVSRQTQFMKTDLTEFNRAHLSAQHLTPPIVTAPSKAIPVMAITTPVQSENRTDPVGTIVPAAPVAQSTHTAPVPSDRRIDSDSVFDGAGSDGTKTNHRAGDEQPIVKPLTMVKPHTNVVALDNKKKKAMVLDKLDPELRVLVQTVLDAYERGELDKLTREPVRKFLNIATKKASAVAKAAKAIHALEATESMNA